ncbi:hypothetical protein [Microbacterium nymphoidis]|uniref:hypothetical protein n=1 Tax=Microbacterium nymphoidis TaxID=2898586 RepID=UPI001E416DBC|nr:hypothetical protein [Microbacterium nymphoidis]MCD2499823.1 hypothetical protein [Microbacterium nymphoidis]
MSAAGRGRPETSVWYFVGAVFIFAVPNLVFRDIELWARIGVIALGFAVMAAGFVQLRREITAKGDRDSDAGDD